MRNRCPSATGSSWPRHARPEGDSCSPLATDPTWSGLGLHDRLFLAVVLFGSCLGKSRFVVDTVFVTSDAVDHGASDWEAKLDGRVPETYRIVTLEPWYRGESQASRTHRLYLGATPERPVGGMFSFFPCRPWADGRRGFARPGIAIDGFVNPRLSQGKKLATDLSLAEAAGLWQEVAHQVEAQGLALGVHAALPPRRDGDSAASRSR